MKDEANKSLKERAEELLEKVMFEGLEWGPIVASVQKELERARKDGGREQRDLMACGHPKACLRAGFEAHPRYGVHDDYCAACWKDDQLKDMLQKAKERAKDDPVGAVRLIDAALAKLFRPVQVKGEPLSETIIRERD